ncbi:MAG: Na/Pi cotransporter family protein [Sphaerochaetaceae bacterium]|nr:Na/Pi cotransporter family protein [Sphaerochaetaceae bacterium]NLO60494.1 Na/Pi cotransporter family protein [Spirochaetales bacterium]MDD2406616.1 Na/Pi cotransporter family protein [Sphaerochaetaceae bacterium]MDD3670116.1 Na/Pi cotransporter family protein [Sphaerochaetaceae bacterium]MDD4258717.1 Na/Pi cotransporter family protein [Sphaerochaetaceae bacterium]
MIIQVLHIIGSLGLFLFGMRTMSDGIQKAAGERLQSILNYMTRNRFSAIMTGFLITAIVQSSSATTVMVVSFVNAGLLQLTQSIGVIMGANIGTTITGWIVAILGFKVDIAALALPAIGIGFFLMLVKKLDKKDLGETMIGFGLLFMGLSFLKDSVPDISKYPELLEAISKLSGMGLLSYFIFIVTGALLTIIVQSSSAAMAITLTMAYAGWIDYPTAAAIVLGENIGTTVTAYLASVGTSVNARRASRAHTLFNVFGVIWMTPLFGVFLKLVDYIVPGDVYGVSATMALPAHLAMFHSMFNIVNTIVSAFFIKQLAAIVSRLVPEDGSLPTSYSLKYIRATLQDTPEFYLLTVKRELSKMADIISDMFNRFWDFFSINEKHFGDEVEVQKKMEDLTDKMQEEITKFLSQCSLDNMNQVSAKNVYSMIRITNELESIGDSCYNLMILAERRSKQHIVINQEALDKLLPYVDLVKQFIRFIRSHLNEHLSSENMAVAVKLEEKINKMRNTLKQSASKRLQDGSNVRSELLYIDIVRHVEQIGDHSLNITQSLNRLG